MGAPESSPTRTPPRSRRRYWLGLAAGGLLGLVALEGALRVLLFRDVGWLEPVAARFRNELHYAFPMEDDCWKLRARFAADRGERAHPYRDELLGWTNEDIEPGTLRHRREPPEDGRQLVLLYGNSFARSQTERAEAWEGLLERSELGASHLLLNFGVGGYGLDQIHLLLATTVDRYLARDPLVIFAILVDDSLDRAALALRNYPKPRFELAGDELVVHPVGTRTAAEFMAGEPLAVRSYAWRFLLHGSGLVPEGARRWLRGLDMEEHQALCRRILSATQDLLAARGVRHFVFLFHADGALAAPGPFGWQEPLLYQTLRELELPFVSSKRALLEHMTATGRAPREYFTASRHYTPAANAATFPALLRGIRGEFEPTDGYLPGAPGLEAGGL